jgi:hypothetical protein
VKVWSTELPKNILSQANAQNQQVAFDASKSSTFKKLSGETWKISYGDSSSASGDVGTDVVDLGGLKVEGQAVELAKTLSQQFAEVGFDPCPSYSLLTPAGQWKRLAWSSIQLHQHSVSHTTENSSRQYHCAEVGQGAAFHRVSG